MESVNAPYEQNPPSAPLRLGYLDGIRGVAALTVAIGHCAQFANINCGFQHYCEALRLFTYASGLCVPIFITLSGYCLALPLMRKGHIEGGAKGFFIRRARRILPAYYFALIVAIAVAIFVTHDLSKWSVLGLSPQILAPAFLMHDVFNTGVLFDRPMWSLPVEVHCYLTFPILAWAVARFGIVRSIATAILTALVLFVWSDQHFGAMSFDLYILFFVGVAAAWYTEKTPTIAREWGWIVTVMFWCFAAFVLVEPHQAMDAQPLVSVAFGAALTVSALISLRGGHSRRLELLLSGRACRWIGECSYSIYLLHCPLLLIALQFLRPSHLYAGLYFILLVCCVIPATLVIARTSYRLIELPFMRGWSPRRSRLPQISREVNLQQPRTMET